MDDSVREFTPVTHTRTVREFISLAAANEKRKQWVHLAWRDYATEDPLPDAISIYRAKRLKLDHIDIAGNYELAVRAIFCLYANLDNVTVSGPKHGFHVGCGEGYMFGATKSNSASNLARFIQCRFQSFSTESVGFNIEGAKNVTLDQCTVEGREIGTAYRIFVLGARGTTTLKNCWLEVTEKSKTAIEYDGDRGCLEIDGLSFEHPPEVLLDVRGDRNSRIVFRNNAWKFVPPIRAKDGTSFYVCPSNSFGWDDVDAAIKAGKELP